jgi:hypothetical protein
MSRKEALKGKQVFNDIIDEAYELEEGEEVEERRIMNQLVDGEVPVSDDSQNYVPTPRETEEDQGPGHPIHGFEEGLRESKADNRMLNESRIREELKGANLDPEAMEIFKYITAYTPQPTEIETRLRPFIPDFVPAVGEVDAFLKLPRPDGREETLGLERLDE